MSVLMADTTEGTPAVTPAAFMGLPTTHSLTFDDLALLPDDGRRYEIVDGSLIVSPAPATLHQLYCAWLHKALLVNEPPGIAVVEGANVVLPAEPVRLLVPDVLAVRTPDENTDADALAFLASAVLLTVEVVSPSSTTHDRFTKPALYAGAGIPNYWRVEIGKDGPTVHLYALVTDDGAYTRTRVVRPGQTTIVDSPWKVVLTPPERATR